MQESYNLIPAKVSITHTTQLGKFCTDRVWSNSVIGFETSVRGLGECLNACNLVRSLPVDLGFYGPTFILIPLPSEGTGII